jgi:hypothetical protein
VLVFKRSVTLAAAALLTASVGVGTAWADGGADGPAHGGPNAAFTVAVYGDAPYGTKPTDTAEFAATPAFIDSVNADPDVSTVIHVGDIHSGKQYCTQSYDQTIVGLWSHYADPVVYTPGDNEWADCHKVAEGGGSWNPTTGQVDHVLVNGQLADYAGGDPVDNLGLVRSIFFPSPGATLGSGTLHTTSQATAYAPAHPEDAQFVENVRWQQKGFVFVTLDVPGGSNNDADPWFGAPLTQRQIDERTQRTAADLRWLDQAFATASAQDAQGVVVISQADMWDLDGKPASHLSNYEPLVDSLASRTSAFGKPVLLFEGDSHVYRSDNPLQAGAPCTGDAEVCDYDAWQSHPSYDVSNFHRVIVHGSTMPLEWLELTVTPGGHAPTTSSSFGPFSWEREPVG